MERQNSPVQVRAAVPADGEKIISLIKGLADYENLTQPDAEAQARLLRDAFGPAPRFSIFLAEIEGEAAGYAFIFETYSTFRAKPKLYLEDIFVRPEYRSKKAGFALFKRCVEEAQRRGCISIEWSVLDWNELAQKFYLQLGAKQQKEWFTFQLSEENFQKISGIT